jgi:hypothetical protein
MIQFKNKVQEKRKQLEIHIDKITRNRCGPSGINLSQNSFCLEIFFLIFCAF